MSVFECYNWWTTRWTTESIRRSCLGELDAVMNSKAPPAKTTITQALIRKLPLKNAAYDVRDATVAGLVLRVRPSGSMTYLVRLTDKGRRHPRTAKAVRYWWTVGSAAVVTPEHARRLARKAVGQVAMGEDPRQARAEARAHAKRSVTLAQFLDRDYGPWVTANRKTGAMTLARLRSVFSDLLHTPLPDISPFTVERWRTAKLKTAKPATINRDLVALKAALTKAVEWSQLATHPLTAVRRSKVDSHGTVRYLTTKEEARLLKALDARDETRRGARASANLWRIERGYDVFPRFGTYSDVLSPLVRTALHTGLRFGELANLRWADVDLGRQALITVRGEGSKSGHTRHLPLHSGIREVIKNWQPESVDAGGFVFPGRDGERLVDVKTAWAQVLRTAKIEKFRFHDLRHTFASKLVQGGADLNTVRDLLGHRDFAMTLRYSHLTPDNRQAAVALLVGA